MSVRLYLSAHLNKEKEEAVLKLVFGTASFFVREGFEVNGLLLKLGVAGYERWR